MQIVKIKAKKLKSFLEKSIGLMFQDKIEPIYFETRFGIHTFFMKRPIDIIILDKDLVVRKIEKSLKPRRICFWNPAFFRIIELPEGFIQEVKLKKEDKIIIRYV